MNCHRIFFLISIAIWCLIFNNAQGREIVRSGSLSAQVTDSFQCSENIELVIKAPDNSFFSNDNAELQRLVGAARAILGFECGKIKQIAIVGKIEDSRVYQGYSHKNQNWVVVKDRLLDPADTKREPGLRTGTKRAIGLAQKTNDHQRKVKLKVKDPYFSAGIDYEGTCEANPTLPLKQVYKTNPFKAWPEDIEIKMSDYETMGKLVAKQYTAECPGVETISFTIDPVPEDYACRDKEPCYLTWSKQNSSTVLTSQYKYSEKPMLNDYNEVMNAFIEGNYRLLDQYTGYVRFFHNDFLEIYSDFCSKYMTNCVTVDIKTIETRYDSDGFIESKEEVGKTYRVFIDPQYVDRFEAFRGPNHAWGTTRLMRMSMNKSSIMDTTRSTQRAVGMFISDRNLIKNFLYDNKCMGKKTQTLYNNLDRYFKREPPIDLDGKVINSAMPALKKTSATQAPEVAQPKLSSISAQVAVGSWKAVIDGRPVELVLWPARGNLESLDGYVYMIKHDCLMLANLKKDMDQSAIDFGKYGELALRFDSYNVKEREENCNRDIGSLSGSKGNKFQGGGYITENISTGGLNFETRSLYLDKCITACPSSQTAPKKMDIEFKKATVSAELGHILNTFESRHIGKPDATFLSEITK